MNENIVTALYVLWSNDGYMTTSEVAKEVFEPETDQELRNADRKVRHYFEESYGHLTVVSDEGKAKKFDTRDDRVSFGAGMFRLVNDTEDITVGFGTSILFEDEDGELEVVPLQPVEQLEDPILAEKQGKEPELNGGS